MRSSKNQSGLPAGVKDRGQGRHDVFEAVDKYLDVSCSFAQLNISLVDNFIQGVQKRRGKSKRLLHH